MHISEQVVLRVVVERMHIDHVVVDDHDGARRPFTVDGVDHDDRVEAFLEVRHQLNAGDASLNHGDIRVGFSLDQAIGHFDTECVVTPKDVANACNQDLHAAERKTSAARNE